MTKQKTVIFITIGLLFFIMVGLVIWPYNGQKKTKIITQPMFSLIDVIMEKKAEEELKCPPGQKYVDYGRPDIPNRCYTPAADAGKKCKGSADCISKKCIADKDNPTIKECDIKPNQGPFYCPGAQGVCGDGSEIGGLRVIKRDYVVLNLLD